MEVGEVRVADDRDFRRFLSLAENTEGWQSKYNKAGTKVWVKLPQPGSPNDKARMLKTVKFMEDVSAATCYDVLHDPKFRAEWDTTMLEGKEVYMLNPNNDISYYAVKVPTPLKNRDFVMQRTWLDTPSEYIIFNHSIYHKEFPPKKGLIRGESILTGYLIRPKGKTSCELTYVTQMDPKGTVPMWAVNKVAEYLAPSILKNLHKACQRYPAWKSVNNPHYKPWLYPEQMNLPRLRMSDILTKNTFSSEESLEDGELKEDDFKGDRPVTPVPPDSNGVPPAPKPLVNGAESNHDLTSSVTPKRNAPKEPPKAALRQAQSETALNHPSTAAAAGIPPEQPSTSQQQPPSSHHYTQSQHRSDARMSRHPHRSPGHHASSPDISQGPHPGQVPHPAQGQSSEHQQEPRQQNQQAQGQRPAGGAHQSYSVGRDGQRLQNGYGPQPHTSPIGFMRKKIAKWTGARGGAEDLRTMDYSQAQKEIMIREHEARMFIFQEELELKRKEHQARMALMEQMRVSGKIMPTDAQQVLLHRSSSIVMNETILAAGMPEVKKDVNGYKQRRSGNTRAIEQPKADR